MKCEKCESPDAAVSLGHAAIRAITLCSPCLRSYELAIREYPELLSRLTEYGGKLNQYRQGFPSITGLDEDIGEIFDTYFELEGQVWEVWKEWFYEGDSIT